MNFNNINGVWPQIKDYIDSKLGGGVNDKYKHMIYVSSLDKSDFYLSSNYVPSSGMYYTYSSTDISNAWCLILNSKVYYGPITRTSDIISGYYCAFGHSGYSDKNTMHASEGGVILQEGEYINYMGYIYDYQGNIVE